MRNLEIIDDEERMIKCQEMRSSSGIIESNKTEYFFTAAGGDSPVVLSNFSEAQSIVVKMTQVRGFHVEMRHMSLVLCWQNHELMTASA
nr:hypothetical protein [Tanacetum cinerariifolium]